MGFTKNEIINLRLGAGIKAYEDDACDNSYYYFPILSEKAIIAVMTIIDFDNDVYSVQVGKSDFALSLNNISTSYNSPSVLVITDGGFYALNSSDDITLSFTLAIY